MLAMLSEANISDFILTPLPEDNQRFFASLRMTTISFSF